MENIEKYEGRILEDLGDGVLLIKATEEERLEEFGTLDLAGDENIEPDTDELPLDFEDGVPSYKCSYNSVGTGQKYLGVNASNSSISVKSSAGGSTTKATLYNGECFTFAGEKKTVSGAEWHKIECVDPSGNWIVGWYKGKAGVKYWKNNPWNSNIYANDHTGGTFSGVSYLVNKETKIWSGDESVYILAPAGSYILVKSGYQGKTGSTKHSWLLCHGLRKKGVDTVFFNISNFPGQTGYANTNIKTTPRAPRIVGSWMS